MYKLNEIRTILIAGSGIMGASFAQIFAGNGYDVILYDIASEALTGAERLIKINQQSQIDQGRLTPEKSEEIRRRIRMTTDKSCFSEAEFVLEAIAERMEIKHAFWKEVSEAAGPDTVLATNTSGLSITEISKAVAGPERFAGMHWVNPPHLIPLVEVIAGEKSSPETVELIYDLAVHIGQKPVKVNKDPAGFILNRLQYAVIREACNCVKKGYASVEDVDNVMKYGLGMRYACIGPFETMDFGNIETFYNVASYLYKDLCNEDTVPELIKTTYEEGKLGVKNGAGFYDYSGDKAEKALQKRDRMFMKVSDCLFGGE